MEVVETKTCESCETPKPVAEFKISRQTADGYTHVCRECIRGHTVRGASKEEKRLANLARVKERYARNPGYKHRVKMSQVKHLYGISAEDVDAMLEAQDNVCAICFGPGTAGRGGLHVDHDANTGLVRGLLCFPCNASIGHFEHDPERLERAAEYLRGPGWKMGERHAKVPLKPCGTISAAMRHYARDEPLDEACRAAKQEYDQNRREAARVANPDWRPRAALCGTSSGYTAHYARGEKPCWDCKDARAAYSREHRTRTTP